MTIGMLGILLLAAGEPSPPIDRHALASQVRSEFVHAWEGYKRYAWGHDELAPLSHGAHDWGPETLYVTPVDALDSMLLMGLSDEAQKTREFLDTHLSFDKDFPVKNFEITIRILGGLLSSAQLTGDPKLLDLAQDLGRRLLPAFDSPTGLPYMYVNLKTGRVSGVESNPAEIGTLILEFGTLSRMTGKPVFLEKAKNALVRLYNLRAKTGLVGECINVETGEWTSTASHIGGGIDSYYEYLLKCDRLFGDRDCAAMWRESQRAVNLYLADDGPGGLWYGEADTESGKRTATSYGALQAFYPAVLALGGDLKRARRLQDSGFRMWSLYGLEPEALDYHTMSVLTDGYVLRPEIMESAYYLYHYTKDPRYLEMGRTFLNALVRHCRTADAYAGLSSVVSKEKRDSMPSFFLAETLKYLYLLFAPEALDFNAVVFNTEAHPLRRVPSTPARR